MEIQMIFFNNKGVVHIIPLVLIAALAILYMNYRNGNGKSGVQPQTDFTHSQADKESVEAIRQTAYSVIDIQSSLLKQQVDTALSTWNSLTPDQKRQSWDYIQNVVQNGITELDKMKVQFAQQRN